MNKRTNNHKKSGSKNIDKKGQLIILTCLVLLCFLVGYQIKPMLMLGKKN